MNNESWTEVLSKATVSVADGFSESLRDELSGIVGRPVIRPGNALGDVRIHVGPVVPEWSDRDAVVWLHSSNAGVDSLLKDERLPKSALLTRTVGAMGERIGEYVVTWMLVECQNVDGYLHQQSQKLWRRRPVRLLRGDCAVVYGVGEIGRNVAMILQQSGMKVVGVARTTRHVPGIDRVVDANDAGHYLAEAQWVISTLPLTRWTRGYFGDSIFDRVRNACFVNVGRGSTVDYASLRAALQDGRLRRAVLDVFPDEPLSADDEIWKFEGVVVTPHTAGVTADQDIIDDFGECWDALKDGRHPPLRVDRDREY